VSKTWRRGAEPYWARATRQPEFRCRNCKTIVGPPISGGSQRNHCPLCLYSRHVDLATPGDRASRCGSLMAPAAAYLRHDGDEVLVHRCLGCGVERPNRIAADDNYLIVESLLADRGNAARIPTLLVGFTEP
jgi:hypothetical protein